MGRIDDNGRDFASTVAHYMESLVSKREFAGAVSLYESHRVDLDHCGASAAKVHLQAAKALAGLSRYPEALKIARLGQSAAEKDPAGQDLAEMFMTLGSILRDMGEHREAERAFRDAESIFRRNDHTEGQTRALNQLAGLFFKTSDFRQSLSCLMDAIALARTLGDSRKLAFMMGNVGRICTFLGEFGEAEKHLLINVDLSRELEDQLEEARALLSLAYVYIQQGRFPEAEERLDGSRLLLINQNSRRDDVCHLTYLGELYYRSGRFEMAAATLNQALALAEKSAANSPMVGRALRHLAELACLTGGHRSAERLANRALPMMQKADDQVEVGALRKLLAVCADAAGKTSQARKLFEQAVDSLDKTGVRWEKADALVAAGRSSTFSERRRLTFLFRAEEFFARCRNNVRRDQVDRLIADMGAGFGRKKRRTETSGAVDTSPKADFITASPEIKRIKQHITALGTSDLPVLLCGETGVGKDQMARYLHSVVRPDGPYVAINCASVPETLLESELFGYQRGAFTGALDNKEGLFVRADCGVLLLDEIGDMPLSLQAKLLGVLERRTVVPLGSVEERPLDIRLVAATNRNLERMVNEGLFRRDLYFRLSGVVFTIPPLRERREDIGLLASEFMRRRGLLPETGKLPTDLLRMLLDYDWPGNVRELDNKIQRLAVMTEMAADGDLAELASSMLLPDERSDETTGTLFEKVEAFERELLVEALSLAGGNKSEAARILGVHEATVRTKLKRYGITPEVVRPN